MIQLTAAAANTEGAEMGIPAIAGDPSVESVRVQLERILASSNFSRSERLSRFLRFIVEERLEGRPGQLKEYTIGTRVYSRSASFEPTTDAIVRVEARRLRAALQKYYASEGRSDAVWIDVPKGGYEPVFQWRASLPGGDESPCSQSSIAVLPFENLGPEQDQDYFCDGIAEEIINALAQIEGLRVVARTSAFQFKHRHQDVRSIGEALNADTVVEGSVRRDGDRARITVQLIDASDGYHLWSRRFDRGGKDVFAIQDEIAGAVAEVLRSHVKGRRDGKGRERAPHRQRHNAASSY